MPGARDGDEPAPPGTAPANTSAVRASAAVVSAPRTTVVGTAIRRQSASVVGLARLARKFSAASGAWAARRAFAFSPRAAYEPGPFR